MIKSWLQFIKESKSDDVKIWTLSDDDILEYFVELTHCNYTIDIERGFAQRHKSDDDNNKIKNVFEQKVKSGETVTPAYFIKIYWNSKTENDDVTDDLHFAHDNLKELVGHDNLFGADIEVLDANGKLDIDDVKLKGGAFIDNDTLEAEEYLALFVIENKTVKMNSKQVCEYYGWKYDDDGDGIPKAHISVEDMAGIMLSSRSPYIKSLINGVNDDDYWSSDCQPDTVSLFSYTLNSENEKLTIKALSKELGGVRNLLDEIDNENLSNLYQEMSKKSETTENDLIDLITEFLTKERFKTTLERICKWSEIISEIKQTCGDWEMHATVDQNNKEIWDEFIDIVNDEIKDYKIIYKEVKKYYTSSEGKKEYTEEEKFFSLPLNNEWLEHYDYDVLVNLGGLESVFNEWASESSFGYELKPNFSSYGDVDRNALNKEIKGILTHYLKD